jgi:3',5'-cyclic AMP phosphodiesterase CpdA
MTNALVRIIHISDLHHCSSPSLVQALFRSRTMVYLQRLPYIGKRLQSELSYGNPFTLEAAAAAIRKIACADPKLPTWLLCSGDLTSFGDHQSLSHAELWLSQLAQACAASMLVLYGNHDCWVHSHPLTLRGYSSHRAQLNARFYKPQRTVPLPFEVLTSTASVQLFPLDTVPENPVVNALALGQVSGDSEAALQSLAAAHNRGVPCLRIVATHHPLNVTKNAIVSGLVSSKRDVKRSLSMPYPFHVVLSGHTHATVPGPGSVATCTIPAQMEIAGPCLLRQEELPQFASYTIGFDVNSARFSLAREIWQQRTEGGEFRGDPYPGDVLLIDPRQHQQAVGR